MGALLSDVGHAVEVAQVEDEEAEETEVEPVAVVAPV